MAGNHPDCQVLVLIFIMQSFSQYICSEAGGTQDNIYDEDEGETGTYLLPGTFEGGLSSKLSHKKQKHMRQKSTVARLNESGTHLSHEPRLEIKSGNQPFILNGKRTSNTFSVGSIPTKRVKRATRQRVVSPYPCGVNGPLQVTTKTDVSSEDTSSFQDDQDSLHGGYMHRKNLGVGSTMDFEKQLQYDGNEISSTSKKKKKKPNNFGYKNSLNLTDPDLLVVPGKVKTFVLEHLFCNFFLGKVILCNVSGFNPGVLVRPKVAC